MPPMRAGIYARVSSAIQRESHSIESQLRLLPSYVARQGWTLVATYVDDGITGKTGHLQRRDGLSRAMADAAAGRIDVLVVVDMERLTRSEGLRERGAILGAFEEAGVKIAFAGTGGILDMSTGTGDLLAQLQACMAADDNRKRREKVLRGRELAVSRGRKPSGKTPYGYVYDPATGGLRIDASVAEILREVFRRIVGGDSARALGLELERRGVRSPRGGRWGAGLYRVIRSPVYRGEWVVDAARGQRIAVPAIVDESLWFAAQDALARTAGGVRRGGGRPRHVYLCAGRISCGVCGKLVQVHSEQARDRAKRGAYYRCSGRRLPRDGHRCTLPMVQVREVDGRVWAAIATFLQAPDFVERLSGRADPGEAAAWQQDLGRARAQLGELERSEVAILDRHSRGAVSDAALDIHLGRVRARRRFLEDQVAAAKAASSAGVRGAVSAGAALETAQRLRVSLGAAKPEERRAFVHALVPGWGEHRVVLGADRTPVIGVLIRPWLSVTSCGQDESADHGRVGLSFRLVA